MRKSLLTYGSIASRRATSADGAAITFPPFMQGDSYRCRLRILDDEEGVLQEVHPYVRSIKAGLTRVQQPPVVGTFKLRVGMAGSVTGELQWNHNETYLMQELQALDLSAYGDVLDVQEASDSCWLVKIDYAGSVPLQGIENTLEPMSEVRVRAYQENDEWIHEIKLVQLSVAFASTFERILGSSPDPRRIVGGSTSVEGLEELKRNEVQAYNLDQSLRATYSIKINGRATDFLAITSDTDTIQTALNGIGILGAQFFVTTPQENVIYVEFAGELSGLPQDLMEIEIGEFTEGDIEFILDLDKAEVADVLRNTVATSPGDFFFEIRLVLAENAEDEGDGEKLLLFREPIVIVREALYDEQDIKPGLNWQKPPKKKDFIPFTLDQIITGTQYYVQAFGNNSATEFEFTHNLSTNHGHITVRQNLDGGRTLTDNADYRVEWDSDDQFTLVFATAPDTNSLVVIFSGAGPVEVFQAHTHTISQIVGDTEGADTLREELDALAANVATLLDYIPTAGGGITNSVSTSAVFEITIRDKEEFMFMKAADLANNKFTENGIDLTKLPRRAPHLLPAILDAAITAFDPAEDPATNTGKALGVGVGDDIIIPGGGGIRGSTVKTGDIVGCDGRIYYPVDQQPGKDSYHPIAFNRLLWNVFINDYQLTVGGKLDCKFSIALQLANANKQAQWMLVIEKGTKTQSTAPGTQGQNIESITWATTTPLLAQPLVITPEMIKHTFGVAIARGASAISLDTMRYGRYAGANSLAPATANFALRSRLIQFDTEDALAGVGWLAYKMTGLDSSAAKVTITN